MSNGQEHFIFAYYKSISQLLVRGNVRQFKLTSTTRAVELSKKHHFDMVFFSHNDGNVVQHMRKLSTPMPSCFVQYEEKRSG